MRTLPHPIDTQANVFALCLAATTDPSLHASLTAITANLATAAATYEANAVTASLNLIPRVQSVGTVTKAELSGLYEAHLSKTKGAKSV